MEDKLGESSGLKEVPASEIIAKIEKGEAIEYDHVIIRGDLDTSKLSLPKDENGRLTISTKITIENSIICDKISFDKVNFLQVVKFKEAIFEKDVSFWDSKFSGKESINGVFLGLYCADFGGSHFDIADFSDTEFCEKVSFDKVEAKFAINLNYAKFVKDVNFSYVRSSSLGLIGAQFFDSAYFTSVRFGPLYAMEAYFNGDTSFYAARFNSDADFSVCEFEGKTDFNGTIFKGKADFKKSHFRSQFRRSSIPR